MKTLEVIYKMLNNLGLLNMDISVSTAKISYECSELIEELEENIKEFGNIDMYAFFEKVDDFLFLTNYDLIEEDMPLKSQELKEDTIVQIIKAEDILKILKEQDKPV